MNFCACLILAHMAGCVVKTAPSPDADKIPERQLFRAVSSFYCDHKRWPKTIAELTGKESDEHGGVGDVENLVEPHSGSRYLTEEVAQYFSAATTTSPRPILFSVEYTPYQNNPTIAPKGRRRASYYAPPACGDTSVEGRVSIAGGRVVFGVPDGFSPLSTEQLRERWGSGTGPDIAWSNQQATLTVAVRFGEAELTVEGMGRFKAGVEAAYARTVPGLKWIQREIAIGSIPPLLLHEFESDSAKGRQRTVAYSLSFDRSLLSITITGNSSAHVEVREVAKLVRETLKLM